MSKSIFMFERLSDHPDVNAFAVACVWAMPNNPYCPWPDCVELSANDIMRIAAERFGRAASDLWLTVH